MGRPVCRPPQARGSPSPSVPSSPPRRKHPSAPQPGLPAECTRPARRGRSARAAGAVEILPRGAAQGACDPERAAPRGVPAAQGAAIAPAVRSAAGVARAPPADSAAVVETACRLPRPRTRRDRSASPVAQGNPPRPAAKELANPGPTARPGCDAQRDAAPAAGHPDADTPPLRRRNRPGASPRGGSRAILFLRPPTRAGPSGGPGRRYGTRPAATRTGVGVLPAGTAPRPRRGAGPNRGRCRQAPRPGREPPGPDPP